MPSLSERFSRTLPALAALASVALLASQLYALGQVRRAERAANRGEASLLMGQLVSLWLAQEHPITEDELAAFLHDRQAEGLRFVAVNHGPERLSAGQSAFPPGPPREGVRSRGARVQLSAASPPPQRLRLDMSTGEPPSRLAPRSAMAGVAGMAGMGPPYWRGMGGMSHRGPGPGGQMRPPRRGPRGRWLRPPPLGTAAPPPTLTVEIEATLGPDLRADATRGLILASFAALFFFLLSVALRRAMRREQAASAAAADQAQLARLGEMSAVLAHQIRNPLASLKGHAQLLVETSEADSRPQKKAKRIVREAQRLEELTNNLLEFVRAGDRELTDVDLADIVRASVSSVLGAEGIPDSRIDLVVHHDSVVGRADPVRLHEALVNLLTNALQANTGDGSAPAAPAGNTTDAINAADIIEPIEVVLDVSDDFATITVADRGPGVSEEDAARIFEPFHTTRVHGTGLGLAVVHRVVTHHGGSVRVDAREGGGAIFTVRLPVGRRSILPE